MMAAPIDSQWDHERLTHQAASRWPIVSEAARAEIDQMLREGNISLDPDRFERFEDDLCRGFGVAHALLTCNGTAAAFSVFHAIGLKAGDEIVVPAFTHWATALPSLRLGCQIRFADLDPDSLNINLSSVEQAITPKTKAVVACHLYGNPVDIRGLQHLCESRQLHLIEDISHSPGASVAGRPVGSFGQMAFCSMQAAKVIAGGEAGFLLTNDSDFYHRAVELAHPKRIGRLLSAHHRYQGVGLGFKFRPSALHVALAHDAYRQLDASNAVRRDMFEHFRTALGNIPEITFPAMVPDAARVYWEYELLLSNGARVAHVARTMQDQGYIVGTTKLHLLPDLPHFADGLNLAPCPNARHLRDRLLVIRALSQVAPLTAEALGHALRKTIRGGPT